MKVGGDRATLENRIRTLLEGGELAPAATAALKGYGPEILGYLISVTRDESAARDVFGVFSEHLWKGLAGFRKDSSFRTWAYKVAWNAAQMFWRDPYRRRVRRLDTSEYSRLAERLRNSSLGSDASAKTAGLARLRASLAPDEQTLLVLRIDRKLSWQEVAQVMSTDERPVDAATVRKRFERLKERLMRRAQKEGLVAARGDHR